MAFESFLSSITSASLRAVALHWNAARGNRLMPSWDELRPAAMAKQLPIVWSYKFDRSTGEFTGRLAGDRITEVFGKSLRGMRPRDFHPPEAGPWVTAAAESGQRAGAAPKFWPCLQANGSCWHRTEDHFAIGGRWQKRRRCLGRHRISFPHLGGAANPGHY